MTTPRITTVNQGGIRYYVNPETKERAPGVTSVTGKLPKDWMGPWTAKAVATYAIDNLGAVVNLAVAGERQAAIELLKGATRRDTTNAAQGGDDVHSLADRMFSGEKIKRPSLAMKPYHTWLKEFMEQAQPEFIATEQSVWGDYKGNPYAGSFDWLAEIDGKTVLGDTKTTRSGIHPEVAVQLNAYAHAREMIYPDKDPMPLPQIDALAVLHLRPEGWKLVPVELDEDLFEIFGSLLIGAYRWDTARKFGVIGDPILQGGN